MNDYAPSEQGLEKSGSVLVSEVLNVHPRTHTIDTADAEGVPLLLRHADPDLMGGEVYLPKAGSHAVLTPFADSPSGYLCIGFYKHGHEDIPPPEIEAREDDEENTRTRSPEANQVEQLVNTLPKFTGLDGGASDSILRLQGGQSHRQGDTGEAYPGDWILKTTDGNGFSALEGGATILKGSDLAQIRAFKWNDLLHIMARNLVIDTDFGSFRVLSEGGQSFVELEANTLTGQKATGKQSLEISMTREIPFRISLKTNGGDKTLAALSVDSNGNVTMEAASIVYSDNDRST